MEKIAASILIVMMLATSAVALETVDFSISFTENDTEIINLDSAMQITFTQCHFPDRPGYPELPVLNKKVKIPENKNARKLTIVNEIWKAHSINLVPRPQPNQEILSLPPKYKKPLLAPIYQSNETYPDCATRLSGTYPSNCANFAIIEIFPLRYNFGSGVLEILTQLDVQIELEPQQVEKVKTTSFEDYEYLIVGPLEYKAAMQPFIDWKNQKGVRTQYKDTEWIDQNLTGEDIQEKIRKAVRSEWEENSIQYLLLVGDTEGIPVRYAFGMDSEAGDNRLGADLYYADLDGNWNSDGNDTYGEVADNIDMFPDVFVGRAWANDNEDVEIFVSKVLGYEQSPPSGYAETTAFMAEVLWHEPMTDGGIHKDMIDELHFPEEFPPITKLYETAGNETYEMVINTLNQGGHFLNHIGHAGPPIWSIGLGGILRATTILELENADRLWLVHSVGCHSNSFRSECMGTSFMNCPNGGGIAYMGNFSYGWGMPGSPGFGVSDLYDTKFWEVLFNDASPHLGEVFAETKMYFIPQAQEANVFRWVQYSLNLMGDPEMPVWTREPLDLTVDHPLSISEDLSEINVWIASGSQMLNEAKICLFRENESCVVAMTDENGQAQLTIPSGLTGPITITVTAPNHIPYQAAIPLDGLPDLKVESVNIVDDNSGSSIGDGDTHCEPGETIEVSPVLINYGINTAGNVSATLSVVSPSVEVAISETTYGDIAGGTSLEPNSPFLLQINPECEPNSSILCRLDLSFNRVVQTCYFALDVDQEALEVTRYVVYDMFPTGDSDGVLEEGEMAHIGVELINNGGSSAISPRLVINPSNSEVTTMNSTIEFPTLDFGETAFGFDRFWIQVGEKPANDVWLSDLSATWSSEQVSSQELSLKIPVGSVGMYDDVESENVNWSYENLSCGWHVSSHRVYSGFNSWYCGNPSTHSYDKIMDCALTSPPFFITENARIKLARWFEFPIYGEDGLKIECFLDDEWKCIGFIGGGGALNLQSEWSEFSCDIPASNVMTQLRFRFVASDNDTAEGIYIDDIRVKCKEGCFWADVPQSLNLVPDCFESGVKLTMPGVIYQPTHDCELIVWLCNTEQEPRGLDLYVILDAFGEYFFAPGWSGNVDCYNVTLDPGQSSQTVLPLFTWPEIDNPSNGFMFWSGLLDPDTGSLFGEYDYWEFGWM